MADKKLSALTELVATPANDDEVYIRDVSEATADESKRITVANLIASLIAGGLLTTKGDLIVATGSATPARVGVGSNDTVLTADSLQASGVKWAAAGGGGAPDYPMKQTPALVRWLIPGWSFTSYTNQTILANRICYIPIFVVETTTYIRIGLRVGTASAGVADLRIFNWDNGLPSTLVLSAGTIDTGTTGTKEITISQQLTRGYYYLAIRCSGSPSLYGAYGNPRPPVDEFHTTLSSNPMIILFVDTTYADPAPTPIGGMTPTALACVYLREN